MRGERSRIPETHGPRSWPHTLWGGGSRGCSQRLIYPLLRLVRLGPLFLNDFFPRVGCGVFTGIFILLFRFSFLRGRRHGLFRLLSITFLCSGGGSFEP